MRYYHCMICDKEISEERARFSCNLSGRYLCIKHFELLMDAIQKLGWNEESQKFVFVEE